MVSVVCRWLNGDEFTLDGCNSVHDVKIHVASLGKKFFPDVLVLSMDYVLITDDQAPPPAKIITIIKEEEYTAELWMSALVNHARAHDDDAISRACQYIKERSAVKRDSTADASTVDTLTDAPESHNDNIPRSHPSVDEVLRGALRIVCEDNISEAVKSLLVHMNINETLDDAGHTPLHIASGKGNNDVVRLLIADPLIDVNKRDADQLSALHHAAQGSHVQCLEQILTLEDADVNAANDYGYAVLHAAAEFGRREAVAALMTRDNILVNAITRDGWTALHVAATCGCLDVVQDLLAHPSIQVNMGDRCGRTALHAASQVGYRDIINRLIMVPEIDVNAMTMRHVTALHFGVQNNHYEVVRALLSCEALDVNVANEEGATALDVAAAKGFLRVVNMFLKDPRTKAVYSW